MFGGGLRSRPSLRAGLASLKKAPKLRQQILFFCEKQSKTQNIQGVSCDGSKQFHTCGNTTKGPARRRSVGMAASRYECR